MTMKDNIKFVELRADGESRTLEGRAISFETESNDLGFTETLHRGCITQETIDNSDILFTVNHNPDKVVARWDGKRGVKNMDIRLEDDGVYFTVQVPHTTLGDDLLEDVRVGNIKQCSFAFTIPDEPGAQEWRRENGVLRRDVYRIGELFDLSAVTNPAYEQTYIQARSEDIAKICENLDMKKNDKEYRSDEDVKDEETQEQAEETQNEDPKQEGEEPKQEDPENSDKKADEEENREDDPDKKEDDEQRENDENQPDNEEPKAEEEQPKAEEENGDEKRRINIINKQTRNIMKQNFSLSKTILDVAEGRAMSEVSAAVVNEARSEMRNSALSYTGQIQLPVNTRSLTVGDEGADLVEVDIQNVLTPLRDRNIAVQLGARWISGLTSDVQIPVMGKTACNWSSENGEAANGANAFTSVKMTPHRMSTVIDISRQLLIQSSADVESLILNDITEAINDKLEETIFSNVQADNAPSGICTDITAAEITNFKSICDLEAGLESAGVYGEIKYALSPSAKATLRNMNMSGKTTRLLLENGEIDGTQALCSGHVKDTVANVLLGDWSQLAIAQFGNVDITVDNFTRAAYGQIRIVLNSFWDFKMLRSEAFAFGKC